MMGENRATKEEIKALFAKELLEEENAAVPHPGSERFGDWDFGPNGNVEIKSMFGTVHLAYVIELDSPTHPTIMQGDVYGHGEIETEKLAAMLPEGEKLRIGHYRLWENDTALYIGEEGLLK